MSRTHKTTIFDMFRKGRSYAALFVICLFCAGCAVIDAGVKTIDLTTKVVGGAGKLAVETVKTTGKVVSATADLASKTGDAAHRGASLVSGGRIVRLEKIGNSLYVDVLINRRRKARMLLDTGATDMQISSAMAKSLGVRSGEGELTRVTLAGGRQATARSIVLKDVRVGSTRVRNVRALVLDDDWGMSDDGLLGMSYLNNFVFRIDAEKGLLTLKRVN
jgi:clan AA aspartic protease (TIGR02281 family)